MLLSPGFKQSDGLGGIDVATIAELDKGHLDQDLVGQGRLLPVQHDGIVEYLLNLDDIAVL